MPRRLKPNFYLFTSMLFMLSVLCACNSSAQTPPATSQPPENNFIFQVRLEDASGKAITNAQVTLDISGIPPMSSDVDARGYALFSVSEAYRNKVGRITVVAPNYAPYPLNIAVSEKTPPERIILSPLVEPTVGVSTESTASPTVAANNPTEAAVPDLVRQLSSANIPLSGSKDEAQYQSIQNGIIERNGYAALAESCLKAIGNKRLINPVPLDVINAYYKEAIGKKRTDNISLDEYTDSNACSQAMYFAWVDVSGGVTGESKTRTSFEQIVEDRLQ